MSARKSKEASERKLGEETKREMLSLRVTPSLKSKIEAAAAATGRSMSQEIEFRLELSFMQDQAEGSAEAAELRVAVTYLLRMIDARFEPSAWTTDPEAFRIAKFGIIALMNTIMPEDPKFVAALDAANRGDETAMKLVLEREVADQILGQRAIELIRPKPRRYNPPRPPEAKS
jgi:hypothetical protein